MSKKGLNQLLCAAMVNLNFRAQLLANPVQAAFDGYYGQKFSLDASELALISSIRATNIEDFAASVYRNLCQDTGKLFSEEMILTSESRSVATLELPPTRPIPQTSNLPGYRMFHQAVSLAY